MAAIDCAAARPFCGSPLPKRWPAAQRRGSLAGDAIVLAFLLVQCFDGVLTYVGVVTFGAGAEGNPVVAVLMTQFGHGGGLVAAKAVAGFLGICLHLRAVHAVIAWLTGFYVTVAIAPWTFVLFLMP